MKKIKTVVPCITNLSLGYLSAYYVGVCLLMLTNTAKQNNSEGEGMLQVAGAIGFLLWLSLWIFINYIINRKVLKLQGKWSYAWSIVAAVAGVLIKLRI